MNQQEALLRVTEQVRESLSAETAAQLRFLVPDQLSKGGGTRWRLRIVSAKPGTIFSRSWCFIEVTAGRIEHATPNCGGAGVVCFVQNKQCGSGRHETAMNSLAEQFAASHGDFESSRRGDKNQGVYTYYSGLSLPVDQAVRDTCRLIEHFLQPMEQMTV